MSANARQCSLRNPRTFDEYLDDLDTHQNELSGVSPGHPARPPLAELPIEATLTAGCRCLSVPGVGAQWVSKFLGRAGVVAGTAVNLASSHALSWFFNEVRKPVVDVMYHGYVWSEPVVTPAVNAVKTAYTWAEPTLAPYQDFTSRNIIEPVAVGHGVAVDFTSRNIIEPTMNAYQSFMNGYGFVVDFTSRNIIEPVMTRR